MSRSPEPDRAGQFAHREAVAAAVGEVQHGFGPMLRVATAIVATMPPAAAATLAMTLIADECRQVRMVGVLVLGDLAGAEPAHLDTLRGPVAADSSWQVQEMLARAIDAYAAAVGYAASLPVLDRWLADPSPAVRRAVTEGLRIWTDRDYFREQPLAAIDRLASLRADPALVVRKSVGNALRDISRQHPELIAAELATWDLHDRPTAATAKLASRWLQQHPGDAQGPPDAQS